jgi:hypothetical protein
MHLRAAGGNLLTQWRHSSLARGFSANAPELLNARSRRLIIVWLEVRVLPAPPRSPAQTGISRFSANRPELAAIRAHILSLQSADWIEGSVSGSLSLPWKIAFPDGKMALVESPFGSG